jgi:hypothetical protein
MAGSGAKIRYLRGEEQFSASKPTTIAITAKRKKAPPRTKKSLQPEAINRATLNDFFPEL